MPAHNRLATASTVLLIAISVIIAAALGGIWAWWRVGSFTVTPEELVPPSVDTTGPRMPPLPPADGPQPVLVVDEQVYDFGQMEAGQSGEHTFVLKNGGKYPLIVRKGDTTCKCTIAGLNKEEIPPGGTAEVTLDWTVQGSQPEFRHSAKILTNDRKRRSVELLVKGLITSNVGSSPRVLRFSKSKDDEHKMSAVLFASRGEPLEILSHEFADRATAEFFDVQLSPIDDTERLRNAADSGAHVDITIKPGLPVGSIEQRINFHTNREDHPEILLTLIGTVVGNVSVTSSAWDREGDVLRLGTVRSSDGAKCLADIFVRHPQEVHGEMKIVEVTPSALKASLGEPVTLLDGTVRKVPLLVEIPKRAPSTTRLGPRQGGYGKIVVETGHPDSPRLEIDVWFAVSN